MMGNVDALALILKLMSRLQQPIADKITKHRFNTLIDCYAFAQLVEANIEGQNTQRTLAHNPESSIKMTQLGLGS